MAAPVVRIKDETWDKYVAFNPTNPNRACAEQLEKFSDIDPKDKGLVLNARQRGEVEGLAGRSLESGEQLVGYIKHLIELKVGDVNVLLTEGQKKRLYSEALKQGKTAAEYVEWRLKNVFLREFGF